MASWQGLARQLFLFLSLQDQESEVRSHNAPPFQFVLIPSSPTLTPDMDSKTKAFLFDLLNTPSPTGWESGGQRCWAEYARKVSDSVENDAYGTAWATIDGGKKAPRVMLEAHADEI